MGFDAGATEAQVSAARNLNHLDVDWPSEIVQAADRDAFYLAVGVAKVALDLAEQSGVDPGKLARLRKVLITLEGGRS